jgi:hypothetical protein
MLFAVPAAAYHDKETPWVKGSFHTLRQGEFSLGILQGDAGVLDELQVGTIWPLWLAWPVLGGPIPNATLKARSWFAGDVVFSVGGTFLYLDASKVLETSAATADSKARLITFTGSVGASYRANRWLTGSIDVTYSKADISGQDPRATLAGVAITNSLRVGAMGEWRLTRFVALHLKGRTLLYRHEPSLRAAFSPNPWTDVDAELSIGKIAPVLASNVVASVACSGKNVNFAVGGGYGYGWLPLIDLVQPYPGFLADLDLFVRF